MKLSFTSRLLDLVGRTLIGTPADLRMPEDFYFLPGDRALLTSGDVDRQKLVTGRIGIDTFRRLLLTRVAVASSVVSVAVCALLLASHSLVK